MSFRPPTPSPSLLVTPPLWNKDRSKGPRVYPRIYAIPLTLEVMDRFLENYEPDLPRYLTDSIISFQKSVGGYLPPEARRVTYIEIPEEGDEPIILLGIIIASNMTTEDLGLANRPELVKEVQELLQIDTPAAWYRFGEP
ncbi:hypothetical protein MD484_g6277, partial [Candolleomyces efflorescens]